MVERLTIHYVLLTTNTHYYHSQYYSGHYDTTISLHLAADWLECLRELLPYR